jgi:hypothetical protein
MLSLSLCGEKDLIVNLLVRIHFIIVMIMWTGLAPVEYEFPVPGSLTSTFLVSVEGHRIAAVLVLIEFPLGIHVGVYKGLSWD